MDFPELPEDVKIINRRLKDIFGMDSVSGEAMWRVSWSNDQYEKRLTNYTPENVCVLFRIFM
jgi:hypothetical protein